MISEETGPVRQNSKKESKGLRWVRKAIPEKLREVHQNDGEFKPRPEPLLWLLGKAHITVSRAVFWRDGGWKLEWKEVRG